MSFSKKIKWFPYLSKNDGRDALLNDPSVYNKFIVCYGRQNRFYAAFDSSVDFIRNCYMNVENGDRYFYEVINGHKPQKIFFDIDFKLDKNPEINDPQFFCEELISSLASALIDFMKERGHDIVPEKDILIFSSHGEQVMSFHLILDNFMVENNIMNSFAAKEIIRRIPEKFHKIIDSSVYTSLRLFRLFMSKKWGSQRIKIFKDLWKLGDREIQYKFPEIRGCSEREKIAAEFNDLFYRSCIGNTVYCSYIYIKLPEEILENRYQNENYESPEIPPEILKLSLDRIPKDILDVFRIDERRFNRNIIYLKRLKAAYCELCKREHEKDGALIKIGSGGAMRFVCWRDPKNSIKYIGSVSDLFNNGILERLLANLLEQYQQEKKESKEKKGLSINKHTRLMNL